MKPCNNYQMKKACILEMLALEGRRESPIYIENLIKDTALYPVSGEEGFGIACYEKNGIIYMLDFKDQHRNEN